METSCLHSREPLTLRIALTGRNDRGHRRIESGHGNGKGSGQQKATGLDESAHLADEALVLGVDSRRDRGLHAATIGFTREADPRPHESDDADA